MYLKPSEIFYSQDSINNVFDKKCNHSNKYIGETLDDLCDGRCSLGNIPNIIVIHDGKWITADNRRLWVFRQLERLGKCEKIYVKKGYYIPEEKQTSCNGGASVRVRGPPGGYWHLKPSIIKPASRKRNTNTANNPIYDETNYQRKTASTTIRDSTVNYNQYNRATNYGGLDYNSRNVNGTLYGQSTSVRKTPPIHTAYTSRQSDITTPRVHSTVPKLTRVGNQFGTTTNFNHNGYERYDRVAGRDLDQSITSQRDATPRGAAGISQLTASTGSYSSRSSHAQSNYRGFANNIDNERHARSYQPESRNNRHKTYDTSYNDWANSSSASGDNGCCIII